MDQVLDQLRGHVFDQKHCTARGLAWLSAQTGQPADLLAQGGAGLLVLYLLASQNAFFLANLILVVYPLVLTYTYSDERPARDLLLIYWGVLMALTTFDRSLEQIPAYYVMKTALLALFFLEPFRLADKINKLIDQVLEEYGVIKSEEKKNEKTASPAPEKPEVQKPAEVADVKTAREPSIRNAVVEEPKKASEPVQEELKTAREVSLRTPVVEDVKTAKETSLRKAVEDEPKTAREPSLRKAVVEEEPKTAKRSSIRRTPTEPAKEEPKTPSSTRSEYVRTPQEGGNPQNGSRELTDGRPISFRGANPMATDSSYRLRSEGKGIPNRSIGLAVNLNDMYFFPMDRVVFNGPFDNDVTYHMKVMNNSHHDIAYAIKGNCIPRVTAYPPCGILKPKKTIVVAVTLQAFEWNETQYANDRICYEYVLLKKPAAQFSHALLEESDMKRRKNIYICYNP